MLTDYEHIYYTDYGVLPFPVEDQERWRYLLEAFRAQQWAKHGDDLVGVPEFDFDNERLREQMTAYARHLWENG